LAFLFTLDEVVPDLLEVVEVLANDVDLGERVLGPIRITVEEVLADLCELLLNSIVLHVDRIIVETLDSILPIELKLLVLAVSFKVVDSHQDP
jgi:hypothetical protein